jgi:hypothetical protein
MSYIFSDSDLKFKSPFSMVISGPSGSGKTTFLLKFLSEYKNLINPIPKSVLYCYSEYNEKIKIMQNGGVIVHAGVPDEVLLNQQVKPSLLILDDLMQDATENFLTKIFTKQSHHQNISVIFITQNLFEPKLKVARNNSHYIVLLRSPSAALQIRNLGTQLFPRQLDFFLDAYKLATSAKFGYLVLDLHPGSETVLRLRTNIFKERDDEELTIFLPKNG